MAKINKRFRCPNCGKTFIKDDTILHLASGTKFADVETGRRMDASGGYKETMYCRDCQGPVKMRPLIEGRFDVPDYSWAYLLVWAAFVGVLSPGYGYPWWFSVPVIGVLLVCFHFWVERPLVFWRIRKHNR